MPLEAGVRLGKFQITGPLGAGGMGEVYRARDDRLGREVAIKILPESVAGDPSRVARFEREARLLAAINHPGIAAIYGAEESEARRYIVMELVPGDTLAEKLAGGALPIPESLQIAAQIAAALEAAHERGVVHRDLKPSNVKVTPAGKVKLLDFGLAKAAPVGDPDGSKTPTVAADQTRPGMILGTVEFMSPEQARGHEVDRRTDMWAFGCILFEMLSGRRAFTGETPSDVLAGILRAEPDWTALPAATPPRIRQLLERCLQKDPERRLRDAGDVRIEIEQELGGASSTGRGAVSGESSGGRRSAAIPIAAAAVLAALIGAGLLLRSRGGPVVARGQQSLVVLPSRNLSGAPGGQLVGDGLVETLSARLGQIPGIQIVTPATAVAAADAQSDPFRAARTVGANLAIQSSLMRNGDVVRIAYSIWDVKAGTQVASGTVDGAASDLFGIQDRVVERVASGLRRAAPQAPRSGPSGLKTAAQQEKYLQSLGSLQRYDRPASVDAAVSSLQTLEAEVPDSALVNAALGRAYLYKFIDTRDRKWMDLSLAECARAERSGSELPEVAVTRGDLLLAAGQASEAVAAFERALRARPNDYAAVLGLARGLDAAGEAARSEATYRRAIALQPGLWTGYSALAAFDYGHGRYPDAAAMFQKVTELTPDSANAFSNLGAVYGMMGRFDQALAAYRKSLSLAPTAEAYSNVGTADFYLGQYRESADSFERATTITPGHFLFWANLGDARRWTPGLERSSADAYRRAIELARDELRVNDRNAQARAYLAACLAKTGDSNAAAREIREALALEPSNPELLYIAAVVSNLAGRRAESIDKLREAVAAGFSAAIVARDPELADLARDPQFQKIVRSEPDKRDG